MCLVSLQVTAVVPGLVVVSSPPVRRIPSQLSPAESSCTPLEYRDLHRLILKSSPLRCTFHYPPPLFHLRQA